MNKGERMLPVWNIIKPERTISARSIRQRAIKSNDCPIPLSYRTVAKMHSATYLIPPKVERIHENDVANYHGIVELRVITFVIYTNPYVRAVRDSAYLKSAGTISSIDKISSKNSNLGA